MLAPESVQAVADTSAPLECFLFDISAAASAPKIMPTNEIAVNS